MIVRLRVAGLTLRVHAARTLPGLRLHERLRPFTATRGDDIALEVVEAAPPEPAPGARLFDSGGLWSVHRHGRERLYVFREPLPGHVPLKAVLIDAGLRRGTLFLPKAPQSDKAGYALSFPLDEILFQHRLAREGGFFIHASAVRTPAGAVLFCGVSGAGKTTIAGLFARAGHEVLSDDRVAVRPRSRGLTAWGTPWHGSGRFASAAGAPLRAVFFLKQAARSETAPASAIAARLFALTFPPLWDERGVGRMLEACGKVAGRLPVFELRFRKDRSTLAAVAEALGTALGPAGAPKRR